MAIIKQPMKPTHKLFPKASEHEDGLGWSYSYCFVKEISDITDISMEDVEYVLLAAENECAEITPQNEEVP